VETEQLVRSFDTGLNLTDITPEAKSGPVNQANTVFATSTNGYFQLDPRVNDMMVNENKYKSVSGLTNIVSTARGNFAIGSEDGHVRMYTNITQKRAKTDLPGFGDPVRQLDVTKDGAWVLGTCDTYLMLIPTALSEDSNGFTHRMGKEKPLPLKLVLTHADLVQ